MCLGVGQAFLSISTTDYHPGIKKVAVNWAVVGALGDEAVPSAPGGRSWGASPTGGFRGKE